MKKKLIGLAVAPRIFAAITLAVIIFLRLLHPKRIGADFYMPKAKKDFYVPKVGERFCIPRLPKR